MVFKTHMALGGAIAIALANTTAFIPALGLNSKTEFYLFFIPFVLFGSVLPDIDEPKSYIGKKFYVISQLVSLTTTHRGYTHFLITPIIFMLLGIYLKIFFPNMPQIVSLMIFGISFGAICHQIGDLVTKSSIPRYFFPFKFGLILLPKFLRFKTGSPIESVIFILILASILFLTKNDIMSVISFVTSKF